MSITSCLSAFPGHLSTDKNSGFDKFETETDSFWSRRMDGCLFSFCWHWSQAMIRQFVFNVLSLSLCFLWRWSMLFLILGTGCYRLQWGEENVFVWEIGIGFPLMTYNSDLGTFPSQFLEFCKFEPLLLQQFLNWYWKVPSSPLSSLLLRSVNFGIEELHNFQPMIKSVHYTANISRRKPSFLQISAGPVL